MESCVYLGMLSNEQQSKHAPYEVQVKGKNKHSLLSTFITYVSAQQVAFVKV